LPCALGYIILDFGGRRFLDQLYPAPK